MSRIVDKVLHHSMHKVWAGFALVAIGIAIGMSDGGDGDKPGGPVQGAISLAAVIFGFLSLYSDRRTEVDMRLEEIDLEFRLKELRGRRQQQSLSETDTVHRKP